MCDHEQAESDEAARRAREDMRAATERLRARLEALRRLRREPERPPTDGGGARTAPDR
jgi:hypothetical protein